jgi:hypothetical protein
VRRNDGHRLVTVASRGVWPAAGDLDFEGPAADAEREVSIAVLDERGGTAGVISLRGLPGELRAADLADLRVLAGWLAPALSRPLHISGARKRITAGGSS